MNAHKDLAIIQSRIQQYYIMGKDLTKEQHEELLRLLIEQKHALKASMELYDDEY